MSEKKAQLSAAAPDLLEELEQQADGCSTIIAMIGCVSNSTLAFMLRLQEKAARAVIVKATLP